MNTNKLKAYAPKARLAFMVAVEKRAATLGLYADRIAEMTTDGDNAIIEGRIFTRKQGQQRNQLVRRIKELGTHNGKLELANGFNQFINEIAFTWFNRFTAIRYMEVNEYLDHGFRVLSKAEGAEFGEGFEILGSAADVAEELGLDKEQIIDMVLDGSQEEELYRTILLGQCHQLSESMPFMFEKLDDATELLLPDNLTKTDSILKALINDIPEDNWKDSETGNGQIEAIGWLYQFYISEHKDAVIGKVVKREDIPAATQLFTPNWIVKYLVQNSLGRQWLATYPESELKDNMEYYIAPAEQSDEVIEQLKAITPSSIDPEQIKVLDPACGSGHILVEVYELLREIYHERGYRRREIPELILTKNIYGLDIDDRAAQMAAFAVLMKAREDDDRIFSRIADNSIQLNIHSLQSTEHLDIDKLWDNLNLEGKQQTGDINDLFGTPDANSVTPAQAGIQCLSKDGSAVVPVKTGIQCLSKDSDIFTQYHQLLNILKTTFIEAKNLGSLIEVKDEFNKRIANTQLEISGKNAQLTKMKKALKKQTGDLKLTEQTQAEIERIEQELPVLEQQKQFVELLLQQHVDLLLSLKALLLEKQQGTDAAAKDAATVLLPIIDQAITLSHKYDVVVANPPYMGSKGMNATLKDFAKRSYPNSKSDLFAMFIERVFNLLTANGYNAQVNMQSWMFLSSFEKLRESLLESKTFITMAHLGARAFGQISGEVVQTTAWVLNKQHVVGYQPSFLRLIEGKEEDKKQALLNKENIFNETKQDDFKKIPGSPIAYFVNDKMRNIFSKYTPLSQVAKPRQGLATSDDDRFLRRWHEVDIRKTNFSSGNAEHVIDRSMKWFPFNKGGGYRKWYGNNEYLINWENDGEEVKAYAASLYGSMTRTIKNIDFYFQEGITWSLISSRGATFRYVPQGFIYGHKGSGIFSHNPLEMLSFLNSSAANEHLKSFSSGIGVEVGHIKSLPYHGTNNTHVMNLAKSCIEIAKKDWDLYETSWDYLSHPLVSVKGKILEPAFDKLITHFNKEVEILSNLENELSTNWSKQYHLDHSPIPLHDITLSVNNAYYYPKENEVQSKHKRQSETFSGLVSYSVGSMMGRYSLDREGLVYAHSGNNGFKELVAEGAYKTFPADDDGIVPLADEEWLFDDDATTRFREFVKTVWGKEHLQENLDFVAESLCLDAIKPLPGKNGQNESAMATIRRYFSTQFYKDHLKTYKKRPIYWLFSSGKEKAFECLVYLHRYHEGTLSRMRTEYVTPLMGKLESRKNILEDSKATASGAELRAMDKELKTIDKKQTELAKFDEELKHLAEMKISLDLDDGVKVNYGKFGNLLSDVKAIHGKKPPIENTKVVK